MPWYHDPVRRGFVLLSLAVGAVGFALSSQQTVIPNFFNDVLHMSGPEFGYITAIREVPGFLLIFVVAVLYRLPLPKLTALALCLLTLGYALFGTATSFWTVAPWVIVSSLGYHTLLQTQSALAMSLTHEGRSGEIMSRVSSMWSWGSMLAVVVVWAGFQFNVLNYLSTFLIGAVCAAVAAASIYFFPAMRDGKAIQEELRREPIVFRREYLRYYALKFLDGARQQVFFSFGVWVLVNHYGLDVERVAIIAFVGAMLLAVIGPRIGKAMDRYGERTGLGITNVLYILILGAYALVDNPIAAAVCYTVYQVIAQPAEVGSSMYLRKIAPHEDLAPSLAMGLSISHAAAIIVPVVAGYILNYVGYQVPFLIACGFAAVTFFVTRGLDAANQKSARRLAVERAASGD